MMEPNSPNGSSSSNMHAVPPPPEAMFSMINGSNSGISVDDEAPGMDQGHSLPNVDDLKTSHQASFRNSEMVGENGEVNRRQGGWIVWLALFLAVVVIGVIIGVAVVVTQNENNNPTPSSNTQSQPQTFTTPPPVPATVDDTPGDNMPPDEGKETGEDVTQAPGPATETPPVVTPAPAPAVATIAPGQRFPAIKEYLLAQGISSKADLDTEGSPQARALSFIADQDELKMEPPQGADWTTPQGYEFVSRYAMATLYFATLGQRWTFDLNFLKPTSICYWYSILQYVDLSTELRGVFCDPDSEQPVALLLNQNNMQGTLPPEIGFLTTLSSLDIDFNQVAGSIPDTFQQLKGLANFFAGANRLEGSIPDWIGDLQELKNINFSTNYLTGRLPTTMGNLPLMEGLALDSNLFSANIDNIFNTDVMPGMRNLEQFYLENNQFTGTLGDNFMAQMDKLEYLDISDNMFRGSIPEHLFTLGKLKVLDLHDNEFTAWPTMFPENYNLGLLAVQKNQFSNQPVPASINSLRALNHLDLSQNQFNGQIPTTIGDMKNLTYLFLADNNFAANNIPFWIEGLTNLEELSLKSTQRTGPIPDFLGDLNDMVLLDLDDNALQGTIPTSLGTLENLHILLLNRNNLTSVIPDSFSQLRSLKLIYLEANTQIQGDLGALFCQNPAFVQKPVIVAQCDICNAVAGCCALCCEEGIECNTGIHVPDLDPIWQLGYNRVFFTFGREDFLDKVRDPNGARKLLVNQKPLVGPSQKRLGQRGSN